MNVVDEMYICWAELTLKLLKLFHLISEQTVKISAQSQTTLYMYIVVCGTIQLVINQNPKYTNYRFLRIRNIKKYIDLGKPKGKIDRKTMEIPVLSLKKAKKTFN